MFRFFVRFILYVAGLNSLFALALPNALAQTAPTLTVDATGNPHPINPDVYGIASYSLDAGFAKEIQVPNVGETETQQLVTTGKSIPATQDSIGIYGWPTHQHTPSNLHSM